MELSNIEIMEIANLFFVGLWGAAAISHANSIITSYHARASQKFDKGSAPRAETETNSEKLARHMNQLAMGLSETEEEKTHQSDTSHELLKQIYTLDLSTAYDAMKIDLADPNGEVRALLQEEGFGTDGKEKSWESQLLSYVAAKLGPSFDAIPESLASVATLKALVQMFGIGILCFVPAAEREKLNRWGVEKVNYTAPSLQPLKDGGASEICSLLEHHIIEPIKRGEAPIMALIDLKAGEQTLLSRVQAAVGNYSDSNADGKSV